MSFSWRDTHLVVTGGSQGIGAAVSAAARARGARVSVIARDGGRLREHATAIDAFAATGDVSNPASIDAAIRACAGRNGPIGVLVHCAGSALPGRFLDVDPSEFDQQMQLNYGGTVNTLRAVLPAMVQRGSGHVIVTSSTAALIGVPGYTAYAATKAAVLALVASLRLEIEPSGVRLGVLFPPDTQTPGLDRENLRKPVETVAVSGAIKPVPAERVADAVIRGIERGSRMISVDPLTRILAARAGAVDALARPFFRRTIAKALR